jgi:hypothetical protein
MPTTYIRNAGTWPKVKKAFIRNGGVWSEIKTIWVRNSGEWSKYFVNLVTVNVTTQNNINLRTLYTNQTGDSSNSSATVLFNINGNIGSTSTGTASLITGTWPSESEITINVANGVYVAGAGGGTYVAGGHAISLSCNAIIVNNGVIGGGGGSGQGFSFNGRFAYGGAGAGLVAGVRADGVSANLTNGTGGTGWDLRPSTNQWASGGAGGNLGSAGSGGATNLNAQFSNAYGPFAAGKAIQLNGNTATRSGSGQTLGDVS